MKILLKVLSLIMVCCLFLTGCWDQKVFEEVGFTLSLGIEYGNPGKLLITTVYPVIEGKEKDSADIITTECDVVRESRSNSRLAAPKFIEGGKIQQILISDDLAKEGIHELLEVFQRDVTTPAIAFVTIVEGSPNELLQKAADFKTKPRVSTYLYQLLENNVNLSNIPNTKVFDFDINYFAQGLDPIVPLIRLEPNEIRVTGCALFDKDKMTGKLNVAQTSLLLGMMDLLKNTDFLFEHGGFETKTAIKHGIAVSLFKGKRKINIDFDEHNNPVVEIDVHYRCNLDEYEWDNTTEKSTQEDLEKKMSESLIRQSNEVIKKLQAANCDPIGIGDMIRAKYYDYYKSIDWKQMYPEIAININASIDIENVGIIK